MTTEDPTPPPTPTEGLDAGGWELATERTEILADLSAVRVRGVTRRYENDHATAEGGDSVRFFAVTRLEFEPGLPFGVGLSMAASVTRTRARREFAERLRERGLDDVERDGTERVELPDGTRLRVTRYTATDPGSDLPLECWLGVHRGSDLCVVTGGHPADTPEYREAFFELLGETSRRN